MVARVKGTQDFIDLSLHTYVLDRVAAHFASYNIIPIETPILEHTSLFVRSLGQHTDVVSKEMFVIAGTSESEDSLCLRPEGTAATVRAFIDNNIVRTPWNVWSYGPMFRYERPQKGRYRQFHQINVEMIGVRSIEYDVQCITMLDRFFSQVLGLDTYALTLNFLGCHEDRIAYKEILGQYLDTIYDQLCTTCHARRHANILRIFDCKNPQCHALYEQAPHIIDHICHACQVEWTQLKNDLELLSVSFTVRPTLVRGLDYYNKTVFEFVSSNLGAQNAFCGGGRYDQLVAQLGGKNDEACMGAAIGMERLLLLLEPHKERLLSGPVPSLSIIIPVTSEQYTLALLIADQLRSHHVPVQVLFEDASLKSLMRKADKFNPHFVIIIGEQEQQERQAQLKNMRTGTQTTMSHIELIAFLTQIRS